MRYPTVFVVFALLLSLGVPVTQAEEATAQTPHAGRELLTNGDFRQGMQGWALGVYRGARAQWQITQGTDPTESTPALQVVIEQPGTEKWGVKLEQRGLAIRGNYWYQLSFWAKSSQSSARMYWNLQQAHEPYRILASGKQFSISDRWEQYTLISRSTADDPNVMLNLIIGYSAATYWFASVSLQESEAQPTLAQQPEEQGAACLSQEQIAELRKDRKAFEHVKDSAWFLDEFITDPRTCTTRSDILYGLSYPQLTAVKPDFTVKLTFVRTHWYMIWTAKLILYDPALPHIRTASVDMMLPTPEVMARLRYGANLPAGLHPLPKHQGFNIFMFIPRLPGGRGASANHAFRFYDDKGNFFWIALDANPACARDKDGDIGRLYWGSNRSGPIPTHIREFFRIYTSVVEDFCKSDFMTRLFVTPGASSP